MATASKKRGSKKPGGSKKPKKRSTARSEPWVHVSGMTSPMPLSEARRYADVSVIEKNIFQEDMEAKEQWAVAMERRLPPGTRVRVIASDLAEYIGAVGRVADYDIGGIGDWPLIGVRFDSPVGGVTRDGFYEDEIKKLRQKKPTRRRRA